MGSRAQTPLWADALPIIPTIHDAESFSSVVKKLHLYITEVVDVPHTFEELKVNPAAWSLAPLVTYLADQVHHQEIVAALLALKGHFDGLETDDNRDLNQARGFACEVIAWRIVTNLSEREAIDLLCFEVRSTRRRSSARTYGASIEDRDRETGSSERTPLLEDQPPRPEPRSLNGGQSVFGPQTNDDAEQTLTEEVYSGAQFENLSALEIAAVVGAKKFLSQRAVQRIVNGIWKGDIIFWETLSIHAIKKARIYNKRTGDTYARLRVPRYLKSFEVVFFISFLALYYAVLVEKSLHRITPAEVLLYVWIAGFAYEELGELQDAGQTSFYTTDFWFIWDIGIVLIGVGFFILRVVGLKINNSDVIDTAFDLLALEALLLFPRICSLLSLHPYFGTLIPCLREMTKDFIKFLSLVVILYLGFLTAFTMLARGSISAKDMSWLLIQVFFGSSYLGFDKATQISAIFGPPIMLVFVCLTNILLVTSLISLLSNSLARIMDHAREEFLFGYSVYVLEASTSNRLTYYLPPLNLLALLFRPARLFVSAERLRSARIILLRLTHLPYVAAIWSFENGYEYFRGSSTKRSQPGVASLGAPEAYSGTKRGVLRLSMPSPRYTVPNSSLQASSGANLPGRLDATGRSRAAASTKVASGDEEIKSLVLALSSQVEQLTATIERLQGQVGNISG